MAQVNVYNSKGEEVEKMKLSDSVFGLPKNDDLVHQVMVALSGNARQPLAHTKNRGERAGSGRKPWRQKGTGRARVGSVRTPVWRKGGVAFGPRSDRNYTRKINKKMKSKAIMVVLSGKLKDGEIIVIDKLSLAEKKTKQMVMMMKNLKINKKALIAYSAKEKDLRIASRNIPKVENVMVAQLNVLEMLSSKYLLLSKDSIKYLEEKYNEKK